MPLRTTLDTLPLAWIVGGVVKPSKLTQARQAYTGAEPLALKASLNRSGVTARELSVPARTSATVASSTMPDVVSVAAFTPISSSDHDTSAEPLTLFAVLPIVIVREVPQLAVVMFADPSKLVPLIVRAVWSLVAVPAFAVLMFPE